MKLANQNPQWIDEAIESAWPRPGGAIDAAKISASLLEHLPIARMVDAAAIALGGAVADEHTTHQYAAAVVTAIAQVLADGSDHDVVDIFQLYQASSRALDLAGVPYAINEALIYKQLDQPGRIAWLATQRPTALDLHRAMDGVSATVADLRTALERERAEREQDLRAINTLRAELRELQDKLDQATGEAEELAGEVSDLQDQNDAHEQRSR